MLAAKKPPSTTRKHAGDRAGGDSVQPQISRMAMNSSTVVISMVSDTAMP